MGDSVEVWSPCPAASAALSGVRFGWDVQAPTGPAPHSVVQGGAGGLWDTSGENGRTRAIASAS